jgi:adenylate kinase family enzyme
MDRKTLVVNLFGGPGIGKSALSAFIFGELKWRGVDCEMAREYAKNLVWEGRTRLLETQQDYVFGKQLKRVTDLIGQVDIIITDSPIPFSIIYDKDKDPIFAAHVMRRFNGMTNFNILLERFAVYNPNGRLQTEDQAKEKDTEIRNLLDTYDIPYNKVMGSKESVEGICDMILKYRNLLYYTKPVAW